MDQKEQALQEKLLKRAAIVAGVLRKFISAFYTGRQQMLDEARAAAAAAFASKGKKKRKAKHASDAKPSAKSGQPKKSSLSPVQQAWMTFLADMDERISKQKHTLNKLARVLSMAARVQRVTLDDMYGGVSALETKEQVLLSELLQASNHKVFPVATLNINQLNIKEAVQAATAACRMSAVTALPDASAAGLAKLQDRGASCQQLLQYGYTEADAMRVGYPCHAVVDASQHTLHTLRAAGVGVQELLGCPDTPKLAAHLTAGLRGVQDLKQAGYTALDLLHGGVSNPWSLAAACFTAQELRDAGLSNKQLQLAGLAPPAAQPAGFLASGMRAAAHNTHPSLMPTLQAGTQGPPWSSLLATSSTTARPINKVPASIMASPMPSPRRRAGSILATVAG